ncbi:MAG: abscisic acid-deficient protein Aba4 family protein [Pseudomonadota bacterium]
MRAIFSSDVGVVIGWTHYLAFDLFVGLWIARDADAKSISRLIQAPILLATLMAGPLGLFVWLIVREPAARKSGRPR